MDCYICGKPVEKDEEDTINAACHVDYPEGCIVIRGHKYCLRRVDELIVLPNRSINARAEEED